MANPPVDMLKAAIKRSVAEAAARINDDKLRRGAQGCANLTYFYLTYDEAYGDKVPVHVPFRLTKEETVIWDESPFFPVWQPGSHRDPHGALGAGRSFGELRMCELMSQLANTLDRSVSVLDIGSNAERFRAAIRATGCQDLISRIHHMIPNIQAGDLGRLAESRSRYPTCTCRYEDCPHVACDVHIFQHSLYYFRPELLINRLPVGGVGFASVHHLFSGCGQILKQMAYYTGSDGLVHALAKGNHAEYVHPHNHWLKSGFYSDGVKTLRWEKDSEFFETYVYVFRVENSPTPMPVRCPDIFDPLTKGDLGREFLDRINGNIQSLAKDRAIGPSHVFDGVNMNCQISGVAFRWGVAYTYIKDEETVVFPTDLFGMLRADATAQRREPLLLKKLVETAKKYLRVGNFPPNLTSRVSVYSAVLAMYYDVEFEAGHIGRMNTNQNRIFQTHADVLAGKTLVIWRWYHYLNPKNWWECCRHEDTHLDDTAGMIVACRAAGHTVAPTVPLLMDPGLSMEPVCVPKTVPEPPLAEGCFVRVIPGDQIKPRQPGVRLVLIALTHMMPTTAFNTTESMRAAIAVRIGREVPPSDRNAWNALRVQLADPEKVLSRFILKEPIVYTRKLFGEWVRRYPEHQRKMFQEARDRVSSRGLTEADLRVSSFVKVEKQGMVGLDGPPSFDARGIYAQTPEVMSVTGPIDWEMANQIRKRTDLASDSPAVWVNGPNATAELFGMWYDTAYETCRLSGARVYIYWGDQRRYEAHRDSNSAMMDRDIASLNCEDPNYTWIEQHEGTVKGRAQRFPVEFRLKNQLVSGKSKTSRDSAVRNVSGLVHVFGEPVYPTKWFAYNGDDWLVITTEDVQEFVFHAGMLELGFESDFAVSEDKLAPEFCQCLPYPVGRRTIWGPKIGRVLSRLPYATTSSKDDPAGVAKGMYKSCHHIPFLKEYLERIMKLAPNAKTVKYEHHIGASELHEASPETWSYIYARYNLTPSMLESFVQLLDQVPSLNMMVEWGPLAELIRRDE